VGDLLNQYGGDPYGGGGADPWSDSGPPAGPSFGIGQLILLMLIGIGVNVLFGFWAKSRGDDHGIHPVLSFCAGFFLGWIGVLIVPVLRTDRVVNTPRRPPPPGPQQPYGHQPNPMYSAGGPPPQPPQGPMLNQPQAPMPPQPPQGPMLNQPQAPVPQQPPQQPAQMLVADEHGYVECPGCGARTKAGRKACMSCGNFLPPVYDPNVQG
jgi:hypothetical protein